MKEERGEGDTNSLPREDEEDNWVDIKPLDGEACGRRTEGAASPKQSLRKLSLASKGSPEASRDQRV